MEMQLSWPKPYVLYFLVIIFILSIGFMWFNDILIIKPKLPANISELEDWSKDEVWFLYSDTLGCFGVKYYHTSYKKCRVIKDIWFTKENDISPDPANIELLDQIDE